MDDKMNDVIDEVQKRLGEEYEVTVKDHCSIHDKTGACRGKKWSRIFFL